MKGGEEKWERTWSPVTLRPRAGEERYSPPRLPTWEGVGAEREEDEAVADAAEANARICEDFTHDEPDGVGLKLTRVEKLPLTLLLLRPRANSLSGACTRRAAILAALKELIR